MDAFRLGLDCYYGEWEVSKRNAVFESLNQTDRAEFDAGYQRAQEQDTM